MDTRRYELLANKPIPAGKTVTQDHSVQTFTVTIRSLQGVHPDTLKNLIQTKYEVVSIEETKDIRYVK